MRKAVVLCTEGDQATPGVARLRELAWERDVYVELVVLRDDTSFSDLFEQHRDVVVAMVRSEAATTASHEAVREACERAGGIVIDADVHNEPAVRSTIDAIDHALTYRVKGDAPRAGASASPPTSRKRRGLVCIDADTLARALEARASTTSSS